jgi:O-antigen/teichoic acid export membrane protein
MSVWRRLAENFGWLLGGQGLSAVFTVGATVICARTLGAGDFGVLVMLHAAALLVRQFCNFKTAEAVVRFGVAEHAAADSDRWGVLLAALWRLDVIGMLLAMLVIAVLLFLSMTFSLFSVPSTAWWYVLAASGFVAGTARGALRVLDRYAVLGMVEGVGPLVRFLGVAVLGLRDAPVQYFVCVWAFALWVDQIIVLIPAWRHVRAALANVNLGPARLSRLQIPGLRRFLVAVYWQSNVDALLRQGPTLLVGANLGTADAGVYRLVRDVADVLRKPVALIRQAVFPDLARMWMTDPRRFMWFSLQLSGLLGLFGVVFMFATTWFGAPLLFLMGGEQFASGTWLMALLVGAAVLELPSGVLRPAIYTLGGERLVLGLSVAVLFTYAVSFLLLVNSQQSLTPGYAALIAAVVSLSTYLLVLWRILRRPINRERMRASE